MEKNANAIYVKHFFLNKVPDEKNYILALIFIS